MRPGRLGFGPHRAAVAAGIAIGVVAPGKTPRGAGGWVKTDRKDAELLARLLLAGQLARAKVPPVEVEAARKLMRCHDACRRDLITARHRISKMLLRNGPLYPKPTTWKQDHRPVARRSALRRADERIGVSEPAAQVDALTARKLKLAEQIIGLATDERWRPTVANWGRFEKAPRVAARLGLTPSLNQSGESKPQGSITKTGPTLARRLLVEVAWHYGPRPHVEPTLEARQHGQPEHVLQIANKAQHRLHRVYQQLKARCKPHGVVTVAAARELACFLWAAATAN